MLYGEIVDSARIPRTIEDDLSFDNSDWFSVTDSEVEDIMGHIRGCIKDMQSLLIDVGNNILVEEERFSKWRTKRRF